MNKKIKTVWHPSFLKGSTLEDMGDFRGAIRAYRRAAKNGDSASQNNLANLLDDYAEPSRPKEAIYWYKRAIRAGDSTAAYNLAIHYRNTAQPRWHLHWLRVAAQLGDPDAPKEARMLKRQLERTKRER